MSTERKYHNSVLYRNGEKFDSQKEYHWWCRLQTLEQAGEISDLERQVKFVLIPAQYEEQPAVTKTGRQTTKKVLLERECSYIADFVYVDNDTGELVVCDAKGVETETFKIKKKLMLWVHKIKIKILK